MVSAPRCCNTWRSRRSERGYTRAGSHVAGDDEYSIAFARRFGFEVSRRDVKQVLSLEGDMRTPRDVHGVEFVTVAARPELLEAAFPVAQQGYEDVPIDGLDIPLENWLAEEASLPAGSFVALVDDEIVGYAGLCRWPDEPTKAEHGLTVVRRDWRRRGLATALKERQIVWARANGIDELITWTQTGNENMQAVNTRLGLCDDRHRFFVLASPSAPVRLVRRDVAARYDVWTGRLGVTTIEAPSTSSSPSRTAARSSSRSAPAGSRCRSPRSGVRVAGVDYSPDDGRAAARVEAPTFRWRSATTQRRGSTARSR